MSGNDIAYHLRQNKAIDRNLFIDLLTRVGRVTNISEYEYIGFGGPLLEDYKALHAALRIKRMHSIENNDNTYKRQKFNRPATFIKLHNKNSDDFFRHHQFHDKGTIVWLDYTSPGELSKQLEEFRQVVSKLGCFDVAKLTLNANPASIKCEKNSEVGKSLLQQCRLDTLKKTIPDYVPSDLTSDGLTNKEYPNTLQRCVQSSLASLSARATGRYFHILSSFVYKDGQQMLTITGMVFDAADDPNVGEFITKSRIKHWPFSNLTWKSPRLISVPALSAKERMILDSLMPVAIREPAKMAEKLQKKLGYVPGPDLIELANYALYYRAYPHFSRVIL